MTYLNIITCTYKRDFIDRIKLLTHLKSSLINEKNIRWIIVDDSDTLDEELSEFIPDFGIHLFIGPTKDKGHVQRNFALEYIYDNNFDGLIYNADDDNRYHPYIWTELRKTKYFATLPVGNLGPNLIEKPIVNSKKIIRWDVGWKERKYPIDMAGFCFHTSLLKGLKKPFWEFNGVGGESEFIDKIINSSDEIEFLARDCEFVYIWHNELLKYY